MNLAIAKAHGQAKSNFGTIANTDIALLIVSLAAVLLQCSLAWLTTLYVHPVIALCTDSSLKLHLYSDHIIYVSGSKTLYLGYFLTPIVCLFVSRVVALVCLLLLMNRICT